MWLQENFWWFFTFGIAVWFFRPYLSPIGGLWLLQGEEASPWQLRQIGPWVIGEQKKPVGHHKFQGRFKAGVWHISRRDHGKALFEAQGFPETIAFLLSGRTMVEYRLKLTQGNKQMTGEMIPRKVTFIENPPRLNHLMQLEPVPFVLTKKTTM